MIQKLSSEFQFHPVLYINSNQCLQVVFVLDIGCLAPLPTFESNRQKSNSLRPFLQLEVIFSINDAFQLFLLGVWRTYCSKKLEFLAPLYLLEFRLAPQLNNFYFNQAVVWSYENTIGSPTMDLTLAFTQLIFHVEIWSVGSVFLH